MNPLPADKRRRLRGAAARLRSLAASMRAAATPASLAEQALAAEKSADRPPPPGHCPPDATTDEGQHCGS